MFVHLHNHSYYSLLDGLSSVKQIVDTAKRHGMSAVGLTDHGVMHGVFEFYEYATKSGIKPILGMEAYICKADERMGKNKNRTPYHLLLLAKSNRGYENLIRIASAAQLEGFYQRPQIDHQFLEQYSEGIIATSGCIGSEIPELIKDGKKEAAERAIEWYRKTFKDFYIELQSHSGETDIDAVNEVLLDYANKYSLPLVATNDTHYASATDEPIHDTMLCIGTHGAMDDPNRMKFRSPSYYIKTEAEMRALEFPPEAYDNSVRIAEQCSVSFEKQSFHLPHIQTEKTLRELALEGLEERYDHGINTVCYDRDFIFNRADLVARLEYELGVIEKMGFGDYFLIVWDIINFCKQNSIWYNIRGSAAGSMVAFCLGITEVEPVSNALYFERFLNPSRVSMPDIDMDFADDQRHLVVDYTVEKYGKECVAQIITFGTMGAKMAFRDVGRVLNVPLPLVNRLSKNLPDSLMDYSTDDPDGLKILYTARALEGKPRNASTHAAGVVIADKDLREYVPLYRLTGNGLGEKLDRVTQFEMKHLESLGLLKMDYLGVASLTIMRRVCEEVKKKYGIDYNLSNIPVDDPKAFELMKNGFTCSLFQVEGDGITSILKRMQPKSYANIIALVALYRPGPIQYIDSYIKRLNGKETVEYKHPDLANIFGVTYGICCYQEQLMAMFQKIAGYSLGEADLVRKAVGKKDRDALFKHEKLFKDGAVKRGYSAELAESLWQDVEPFARYSFNLAHAAVYAKLTCQTAFLKAHYPLEYYAAAMTIESGNSDKLSVLVDEARRFGIKIIPPSINISRKNFSVQNGVIVYGLSAIKTISDKVADIIEAGQPFENLSSCLSGLNKQKIDALAKIGAFDDFMARDDAIASIDDMASVRSKNGQVVLDDSDMVITSGKKHNPQEIADLEAEFFGFYFNGNPRSDKLKLLPKTHMIRDVLRDRPIRRVIVAGIVERVKEITTKKGDKMAFVTISDLDSKIDLTCFPNIWAKKPLREGDCWSFDGRFDKERDVLVIEDYADDYVIDKLNGGIYALQPEPEKRDGAMYVFAEDLSGIAAVIGANRGNFALKLITETFDIREFPTIGVSDCGMQLTRIL